MPGRDKINDIPSTLKPVMVGAAINWKTTAIAEHLRAEHQWAETLRGRNRNEEQGRALAELRSHHQIALDEIRAYEAVLNSIRAHWSAFLLPKHFR